MRLLRLDLLAYGAFADRTLDLDAGDARAVVVYGDNEAGKSTTKRAIRSFFFGIDDKSHDDHRFAKADLRIGAKIAFPNGDVVDVVRRRALKNSLVSPDEKPLGDTLLDPFLHGLSAATYTTIFGLDHEVLREGGQALLDGEGELGESLLSASLGITHLHKTLKDLRARADGLFSIRGTTKPLYVALGAFTRAKKASRDDALKAETYEAQLRGIAEAKATRAALAEERKAKEVEHHTLRRLARALPLSIRERALELELAEGLALANDPDLVGFAKDTALAERALADLTKAEERLAVLAATSAGDGEGTGSLRARDVDLPEDAEEVLREGPLLVERVRRTESAVTEAKVAHDSAARKRDGALEVASPEHAPLRTTIDRFEALEESLGRERRAIDDESAAITKERERLDARTRALSEGGVLPSEAELRTARTERDALLGAAERDRQGASFSALALAIGRADRIADAMRTEADRVASAARVAEETTELGLRAKAFEARSDALAAKSAGELDAWREAWARTKVVPRSPKEMREWLALAERVNETAATLSRAELEAGRARSDEAAWRPRYVTLARALGLADDAAFDQVSRTVGRARREEKVRAERASIEVRAVSMRSELGGYRARAAKLLSRHGFSLPDDREPSFVPLAEAKALAERHDHATSFFRELAEVRARLRDAWPDGPRPADAAQGRTAEDIESAADEIEARLGEISDEIGRLDRSIGGNEVGVKNLQDRSLAAAAAEDASAELAKVLALSREYVRAQASIFLLERAMQDLRDASAGPLVARASELFARISRESFASIAAVLDERTGLPRLRARRGNGQTLSPSQMSDGARDALYLALRIASLEEAATRGLSLPVVLDDVLVHFDDDRARAALTAIGELGLRQQVIFFTHHARLVEIAKEALGDAVAIRRLV